MLILCKFNLSIRYVLVTYLSGLYDYRVQSRNSVQQTVKKIFSYSLQNIKVFYAWKIMHTTTFKKRIDIHEKFPLTSSNISIFFLTWISIQLTTKLNFCSMLSKAQFANLFWYKRSRKYAKKGFGKMRLFSFIPIYLFIFFYLAFSINSQSLFPFFEKKNSTIPTRKEKKVIETRNNVETAKL